MINAGDESGKRGSQAGGGKTGKGESAQGDGSVKGVGRGKSKVARFGMQRQIAAKVEIFPQKYVVWGR